MNTKDSTQFFIITFISNIILFLGMDIKYNSYSISYNLICLSMFVINCIIFNDIYFRIKYIKTIKHLPLNFYPSSKSIIRKIWYISFSIFLVSSSYYCLYFWMNEFKLLDTTNNYEMNCIIFVKTFIISIISIFLMTYVYYSVMKIVTFCISSCSLLLQQIIYNYSRGYGLFSNILTVYKYSIKLEHRCWLCGYTMETNKNVRKLNCPCNESFHPQCIETYLGMHNNHCKKGHMITKFEHTA